ncbi:MAG: hypothetical protein AB7R40_25180 [Nitrospiraceae bacterium]
MALVTLFGCAPLSAQQPTTEGLQTAIEKVAVGASIVQAKDVDPVACQPVGENPGFLRADFNGDGRDDYAVLLKTGDTGKERIWEGKTLRETRFTFVFFLDDGAGGYKPRVVRRYVDFIPTAVVLDLQPAGDVRHRETGKHVRLKNPGITLSFCEKSATTYFLLGGKVRSIPIAD